jgi:hypothetical protein
MFGSVAFIMNIPAEPEHTLSHLLGAWGRGAGIDHAQACLFAVTGDRRLERERERERERELCE